MEGNERCCVNPEFAPLKQDRLKFQCDVWSLCFYVVGVPVYVPNSLSIKNRHFLERSCFGWDFFVVVVCLLFCLLCRSLLPIPSSLFLTRSILTSHFATQRIYCVR